MSPGRIFKRKIFALGPITRGRSRPGFPRGAKTVLTRFLSWCPGRAYGPWGGTTLDSGFEFPGRGAACPSWAWAWAQGRPGGEHGRKGKGGASNHYPAIGEGPLLGEGMGVTIPT